MFGRYNQNGTSFYVVEDPIKNSLHIYLISANLQINI